MNKFLIAILLTMASLSYGYAQMDADDIGQSMKKWGAKIGGNISTFSTTDNDVEFTSAFGLYFGGYTRMPLNENFDLQFEAGYSVLGAKQKILNNTYSLPVGYIALGGLVKFFPLLDIPGISINAGLHYGYMIYARMEDLDMLNSYKASDFDILAGISFEFDNGLNIEFRYLLGLSNIWNQKT